MLLEQCDLHGRGGPNVGHWGGGVQLTPKIFGNYTAISSTPRSKQIRNKLCMDWSIHPRKKDLDEIAHSKEIGNIPQDKTHSKNNSPIKLPTKE